jgi:hypothetical protein
MVIWADISGETLVTKLVKRGGFEKTAIVGWDFGEHSERFCLA